MRAQTHAHANDGWTDEPTTQQQQQPYIEACVKSSSKPGRVKKESQAK